MEPAVADAALVVGERQHPLPLPIVPLGLAGDDRVAGQVALGVIVLVALLGLPTQQAPLGNP